MMQMKQLELDGSTGIGVLSAGKRGFGFESDWIVRWPSYLNLSPNTCGMEFKLARPDILYSYSGRE